MTQKKSLKKSGLNYSKNVVDVVQFGSSVIEGNAPNDIDIAVIYNKIPLKEQLEESQKIKMQLQKKFAVSLHVKSYDFYSLFDKGNFARESIIFYGKSLITKDYFIKMFGLVPRIQISYSLNKLEKKDKIRFNYLVSGKKGEYGLLRKYKGRLIKPGLIEISPEHEKIFTDSIKKIISSFEVNKIFISVE